VSRLRSIFMPLAIILGILLPQAHVLAFLLPYMIGIMMVLTFASPVPRQEHGETFRIVLKSSLMSLFLAIVLFAVYRLLDLPIEIFLSGLIIILAPPANAAPAMAKVLGGNSILALKIFISGNVIACFSIPLIFGYFTGSQEGFLSMAKQIFGSIQPIITIPLSIALGLRAFYPEIANRIASFQKYTMVVWMLSVFIILAKASHDIREMGFMSLWQSGTFPILGGLSLFLCVFLFLIGWLSSKDKHPIEGAQSMGQKNTTLIIWITQMYAGPIAAIGPVFYVVWQNLVLSYMSRGKKNK
jgi:bile acid:Na+ symporter, BASS family